MRRTGSAEAVLKPRFEVGEGMAAESTRAQAGHLWSALLGSGFVRWAKGLPWWVSLGAVALVLGLVRAYISGVGAADEAWFLYVSHRLNLGQTLYRDVWVPVFPLAVWVANAFTRLLGEHVFVLKLADTVCFTVTVLACAAVIRRITPRRGYTALMLAIMLGWTGPGVIGPGSLYTALGYALMAVALALSLAWIDSGGESGSRDIRLLLAAAGAAGLAFCSKQPVGAVTFAAVAVTVLVSGGRRDIVRSLKLCVAATGVFVGVLVASAIPALISGGLPAFMRDTLSTTGSASYLRMAEYPYIVGLGLFVQQLIDPFRGSLSVTTMYFAYLVPLFAAPLFAWSYYTKRDIRHVAIGVFCVAALVGTYPRTDEPHFMAALPFLAVALIVSWETLRPQVPRFARLTAIAALAVLIVARLGCVAALPLSNSTSGLTVSHLPHFEGSLLRWEDETSANEAVRVLNMVPQRNIFILSLRAGLLYLGSGREDPTAYDYPDLAGFGSFEQDDIVNAVEDHRVEGIWFDEGVGNYPGWKDSRIWAYISNAMVPTGTVTPWGQLYVPSRP